MGAVSGAHHHLPHAQGPHNAYLEVMADLLGSIGDIAAAMPWGVTGWHWIDQPIRRPGVS